MSFYYLVFFKDRNVILFAFGIDEIFRFFRNFSFLTKIQMRSLERDDVLNCILVKTNVIISII